MIPSYTARQSHREHIPCYWEDNDVLHWALRDRVGMMMELQQINNNSFHKITSQESFSALSRKHHFCGWTIHKYNPVIGVELAWGREGAHKNRRNSWEKYTPQLTLVGDECVRPKVQYMAIVKKNHKVGFAHSKSISFFFDKESQFLTLRFLDSHCLARDFCNTLKFGINL